MTVGPTNPAAVPSLENEMFLRDRVLAHLRATLGLAEDDDSPEALEKLSDALDVEAEKLVPDTDEEAALRRLSEKCLLTSDQYDLEFNAPLLNIVWGKSAKREQKLARQTVRRPHFETQYGPAGDKPEPDMVSIFARWYKEQKQSFLLFVDGSRYGAVFRVMHIWRIYPDEVTFRPDDGLIDIMRAFAEAYGVEMTQGGVTGKFIEYAKLGPGEPPGGFLPGRPDLLKSGFSRTHPVTGEVELVFSSFIDVARYKASMTRHGA
ncbi:MAG: hypothetical protein H7840_12670 [Alphaproteobacteria bacterium]